MMLTLQSDFIEPRQGQGASPRRILWRHALRNSLFSLLTASAAGRRDHRRRGHRRDVLRPRRHGLAAGRRRARAATCSRCRRSSRSSSSPSSSPTSSSTCCTRVIDPRVRSRALAMSERSRDQPSLLPPAHGVVDRHRVAHQSAPLELAPAPVRTRSACGSFSVTARRSWPSSPTTCRSSASPTRRCVVNGEIANLRPRAGRHGLVRHRPARPRRVRQVHLRRPDDAARRRRSPPSSASSSAGCSASSPATAVARPTASSASSPTACCVPGDRPRHRHGRPSSTIVEAGLRPWLGWLDRTLADRVHARLLVDRPARPHRAGPDAEPARARVRARRPQPRRHRPPRPRAARSCPTSSRRCSRSPSPVSASSSPPRARWRSSGSASRAPTPTWGKLIDENRNAASTTAGGRRSSRA